jgi:hypothetical protein
MMFCNADLGFVGIIKGAFDTFAMVLGLTINQDKRVKI